MARRYEGSPEDNREDKRGERAIGKSHEQYERTPRDKREDRAGQKRLVKRAGKRR
jgi:hypothetical protein